MVKGEISGPFRLADDKISDVVALFHIPLKLVMHLYSLYVGGRW